MKKDWNRCTAGCLFGLALVFFLTGCETKKSEPLSQAPEEQSQSMGREPEQREGAALAAPEFEKGEPEAAKQQRKSGRAG